MHPNTARLFPGWAAKILFLLDAMSLVAITSLGDPSASAGMNMASAALLLLSWFTLATLAHGYDHTLPLRSMLARLVAAIGATALVMDAAAALFPALFVGVRPSIVVMIAGPMILALRFTNLAAHASAAAKTRVLVVGRAAEQWLRGLEAKHILVGELEMMSEAALQEALLADPIEEVYVAAGAPAEVVRAVVAVCERMGVPFALQLHEPQVSRARLRSGSAGTCRHYVIVEPKDAQKALKRIFDVFASGFALLVLSPLLLTVALLIKLGSRGPVLFKQTRVGLHGRRFSMLKFRSMVINAEAMRAQLEKQNEQSGPVFKMKHDPRVTAVGRFIRKFSIDELPQLVNILLGDMSVVGPRPPLVAEVKKYEPWQRRRLSVPPGLTCIWQVSGRNQISFEDWMRLDIRYIDEWSFWLDLTLIAATVPVVVTGRGAS
jgi:exopolysaccharide biosynthesis polyprenyl glycosylphosphotransferase